jgi:hypothetical protein
VARRRRSAATDANWRTAANWVGDVVPNPGDDLVFPAGAAELDTVNDFSTGTAFRSIVIQGSGYRLGGNAVVLQHGITCTGSGNTVGLPITLDAPQTFIGYGGLSLNGTIDQSGHVLTFGGTGLTVNGELTGAGGIAIEGSGVVFAGANSYSGPTTISGQLSLRHDLALGAGDGTEATGTTLNGGTLRLDGALTVGGELLTGNGGALSSTGDSGWNGNVVLNGDSLTLHPVTGTTLTISGDIGGNGGVGVGSNWSEFHGRLVFSGTNTYLGQTLFAYGNSSTLLVNGTQSSSAVYFHYRSSGTLGGSGSVGDLLLAYDNGGSKVSPGMVPGPGILRSGSADLRNTQFVVELNGDTAGNDLDDYDQLQVTGTLTLGNSLTVSIGSAFTPVVGQPFKIIDNDGADPVSGTFKDLPEGSLLALGRDVLRISYVGGDGNDVVLTKVAAAFWDGVPDGGGTSPDAHWRTATNWVGDELPDPGSNLIFPAGPSALSAVNDFPPGTVFGAIVISGSGYTLEGSGVTLQSGITCTGSGNTVGLPITLDDPQTFIGYGGLSLNGTIDQSGHVLTFGGTGLTVNGELTGAGGIAIEGSGVVFARANSYSGPTTISGQLSLRHDLALGAGDGTEATGTTLNGGTLRLDGALTVGGELLTGNGGALSSTGDSGWNGNVVLNGDSLTLHPVTGTTLTISGDIRGNGGVGVGSNWSEFHGRLVFSGTNTYLGQTLFAYGNSSTLLVNGTQSSSAVYFHYRSSGTLGGSGSVGDLLPAYNNGGSKVSPGAVPGPGILRSGSADLRNTQFVVELNGDTAGNDLDDYDQLQVTGTVTLGNSLTVSIGSAFTPVVGQPFKIIDNDGADPVSGTFTDLPEGSLLAVGRDVLRISYVGGDGNDVVLTKVAAAFWDGVPDGGGTSADAHWRTATNWVGDEAPHPGSNLIFPAGPSVFNAMNDFPAGTGFGAIVIPGSGYTLEGSGVTLQSGITCTGSGNTVGLPITLDAPQTFIGYGGLSLNGTIDQSGHVLTFGGTGQTVNGDLTGSGGVVIEGSGVVFAGANSYSGPTTIAGELSVGHSLALGAGDGTEATGTTLNGGTLRLDGALTVGGELLTGNAGALSSTGDSEWAGDVVLHGDANWPSNYLQPVTGTTLTISGDIGGNGGVWVGSNWSEFHGRLVFSGTNTYLGQTLFAYGNSSTLLVNGTQSSSAVYFHYRSSGTLGGSGSVGDLLPAYNNGGSKVSPGAVPGPGILRSGSADLRNTQFVVELNGDTAGNDLDDYDQLQVTGTVTLGNILTVSIGNAFTPVVGQPFKIIDNDGADPVSGTFTDLPEGNVVEFGNIAFHISYVGGDGNDVVLTAASAPLATSEISGNVFNDVDGDRVRGGAELPLDGWTIFLDQDNDGVLDPGERRTTTEASGDFTFSRLAAGTYIVRELLPSGWVQTLPGGVELSYTVTLGAEEHVTGQDFGNRIIEAPSLIVTTTADVTRIRSTA